ncbi:hypothetical protein GCM10027275_51010 [Rhabdobacter roseus]|uniref:FeoB-associated Cys-rich membrane protein n=1 Tax=Rhabdobacter roseus TaxID=1655419 RepID=A0A840TV98_9BACT|nr:FeoB-associated Cys-rich membrane protein [Rhabdobacter roseus]MBB5287174.1 hypothetical protein [Rhabdobacter roseus]
MIQQLIVIVLFLAALGYLAQRAWKTYARKDTGGCAKGCGCEVESSATSAAGTAR